jgi:hypothetical protein
VSSLSPDANVTVPSGMVPDDDVMDLLARLRATGDDAGDSPPKTRADGRPDSRAKPFWQHQPSASKRARLARIASGEQAPPHVIADVRFGEGRYTTCAACDFTCSGETDRAMERAWNFHGYVYGRLARRDRSGPVERVPAPS